jgi:hypothetical protein
MLKHITDNTEKDLIVNVPTEVCGIVRTCRLPAQLRNVRVDQDDKPIYSDVQRAFAKVYVAACGYRKDASQENKDVFTSSVMAYSRNCFQTALWRLQDAINSRDSRNTSSFYLVGVSMANIDGASQLRTWEVAIAPKTARKLGVSAGEIIQMRRFPETATYPAKAIVIPRLGNHVIGLPVGSLENTQLRVKDVPTILGGDCDGDAFCGTSYKTEVCKVEVEQWFNTYWDGSPEYPAPTGKSLIWKDEVIKEQTDEEIYVSRIWQKLAIGRITNTGLALFIAKGVMGNALRISYSDIRYIFERMVEVAMDMKKVNGDDPFLMHKLLQAEAVMSEATPADLEKQGYDVQCVVRLLNSLAGVPIRKIASRNTAFRGMLRDRSAVEQLADVIPAEGFANRFVNMLLGSENQVVGGESLEFGYCKLPKNVNKAFNLTFTQVEGELIASCITISGTAKAEFPTEHNGLVIPLSSISKIIFRETVEVPWQLHDSFTRIGVGKPRMLRSWGEVLSTLIQNDFSYELSELKNNNDLDQANVDLLNLVMKALRRMLTAYEISNGDVFSWATVAGQQKIVVLETKIPKARYKKEVINDPVELEAERRITAGKYLKKMGLINNLSDTISGEPGMAFYKKTSEGRTFATEQYILPHFAPSKRSPVANALSNLVGFTGAHPVSFSLGNKPQAPSKELYCCALPIDLMDGLIVSSALQESFEARIFEPEHGMYSHHFLEDGSKLQAVEADVKGVARIIPETEMPWLRFADGTTIRAELIFQMGSTSHMQLRQTHFRMALEAVAKTNFDAGKGKMRVPVDLTPEQITSACVNSGLYKDADLTVEVLCPNRTSVIGVYPVGVLAVGMHRQIPSIVSSIHTQSTTPEDYLPTTTADGGIKNGLAGVMCMKANGLDECIMELHSEVPKALDTEICALLSCIERRK